MKKWKMLLIIMMLIAALACLCGCDAYYHKDDSDWVFGTNGSEINIPEYKVEMIKFYLKTIEKKLDKNKYLYQNEVLQEVA